ncbi:MAG TPA: hypothetical protein VM076_21490 [Gemmatimonadaceae bacterium]|nr:hypothetical protein [Gemmatimonadaceae bacterium]
MTRFTPHSQQSPSAAFRPAHFAAELLNALEASEGRRRRRFRDTTPDAIGLGIKRDLLEQIVRDDPDSAGLEEWLADRCFDVGLADGPVRAMALSIWDEWRLAASNPEFREWLGRGAPSDDREGSPRDVRRPM